MKITTELNRITGLACTNEPKISEMKDIPTPITRSAPSVRCTSSLWVKRKILAEGLGK